MYDKIVILAAGDFPTHEVPLRALSEADTIICCDGAYRNFEQSKQKNGYSKAVTIFVVGDGDSLTEAEKRQLGNRWVCMTEQDHNDLHKAMMFITSQNGVSNPKITILAASGSREDHTMGNIGYLVTFSEEHTNAEIEMLTDHGRFCAFKGCKTFHSFPRQQVSLFAVDPSQPINSWGLRWQLKHFFARRWWQATLNEALADSFTLQSDGWLILFQTYEGKGQGSRK